jgi:hypothetical protein
MEILYRKKVKSEICSYNELEKFIIDNSFYKYFKKFPNEKITEIQEMIEKTNSLSYKNIKPWLKAILKYPESINDKKFLLCMGWDEDEVVKFISDNQKNNSKKFIIKKIESPEKYYNTNPKRVEYWIDKGYSIHDAKIKVSESQRTFSKDICIKKYGEIDGLRIFNERQTKWIKSLNNLENYDDIQKLKNSYDYDKKSTQELIDRSSFIESTKFIISEGVKLKTITEFIEFVLGKVDYKTFNDIQPYISSKIIQKHFNIDSEGIKHIFYELTSHNLVRTLYGTPVYHNGIRFKSVKEYKIALLLEYKNLEYIYEKGYPNSKYKCDFYIPSKDLYIEYYGMLDGKNFEKLNNNQIYYLDKMNDKNRHCELNKINLIYDTDFNNLYKRINKL